MRPLKPRQVGGLFTCAAGIVAGALVGATGVAGAATATNAPPAGYSVVTSAPVTAVSGHQTFALVACPGTTKPISGGAHIDSTSTLVNLNSSWPAGRHSWSVRVNNLSGADVTFEVYAVCIDRPAAVFTVHVTAVSGRVHHVTGRIVECGSGVVVGGGVTSGSRNPEISIHDMAPRAAPDGSGRGAWVVHMNNPTAIPQGFNVLAFCSTNGPQSVILSRGARSLNPTGTQTTASSSCPDGSVPLGGGILSDNDGLGLSMSSSTPQGQGWSAAANNASTSGDMVRTSVICSQ